MFTKCWMHESCTGSWKSTFRNDTKMNISQLLCPLKMPLMGKKSHSDNFDKKLSGKQNLSGWVKQNENSMRLSPVIKFWFRFRSLLIGAQYVTSSLFNQAPATSDQWQKLRHYSNVKYFMWNKLNCAHVWRHHLQEKVNWDFFFSPIDLTNPATLERH